MWASSLRLCAHIGDEQSIRAELVLLQSYDHRIYLNQGDTASLILLDELKGLEPILKGLALLLLSKKTCA